MTMQQKEDLLAQYDNLIWSTVHRFSKRNPCSTDNPDDLYQEAVLAFFRYVEKAGGELNLASSFPFHQISHALCQHVLVGRIVSIPTRHTSDFKRRIASLPKQVGFNIDSFGPAYETKSTDDVIEKIYFDQFVGTLSATEKNILRMKAEGKRNREIANTLGVADYQVTRQLQRMKKEYRAS